MAASDELTWDVAVADGGARRPSLADVGGAVIEDDPTYPPPNTGKMHYADMDNEIQRQVYAQGKVAPGAIISVTFSGSTPSVAYAKGPGTAIATGLFTVTDNGVGDTSITWDSGDLPQPDCEPTGFTINGATPGIGSARNVALGVRVVTQTHAGVAADLPFSFQVN